MLLKEKLLNSEKTCGVFIRIVRNPSVVYLVKNAGLDFFLVDCEHSDYSMESIHDLAGMANALDVPMLVRIPNCTKELISRTLDCGVTGIMIPTVETREQAEILVRYAKYAPIGNRGFTALGAHTNYGGSNHKEIMEINNAKVICIAQIETKEGVENVEEIASVEGLDMLFIGPNDLSVSLGIPGDITNPIEIEAIQKVVDVCQKYNVLFGMHSSEFLLRKFAAYLSLITNQLDVQVLIKGFASTKKLVEDL